MASENSEPRPQGDPQASNTPPDADLDVSSETSQPNNSLDDLMTAEKAATSAPKSRSVFHRQNGAETENKEAEWTQRIASAASLEELYNALDDIEVIMTSKGPQGAEQIKNIIDRIVAGDKNLDPNSVTRTYGLRDAVMRLMPHNNPEAADSNLEPEKNPRDLIGEVNDYLKEHNIKGIRAVSNPTDITNIRDLIDKHTEQGGNEKEIKGLMGVVQELEARLDQKKATVREIENDIKGFSDRDWRRISKEDLIARGNYLINQMDWARNKEEPDLLDMLNSQLQKVKEAEQRRTQKEQKKTAKPNMEVSPKPAEEIKAPEITSGQPNEPEKRVGDVLREALEGENIDKITDLQKLNRVREAVRAHMKDWSGDDVYAAAQILRGLNEREQQLIDQEHADEQFNKKWDKAAEKTPASEQLEAKPKSAKEPWRPKSIIGRTYQAVLEERKRDSDIGRKTIETMRGGAKWFSRLVPNLIKRAKKSRERAEKGKEEYTSAEQAKVLEPVAESIAPDAATPEQKTSFAEFIKKDWSELKKQKVFGQAIGDFVLGLGTGASVGTILRFSARKAVLASGNVLTLGAAAAIGAAAGAAVGGLNAYLKEKRRLNSEFESEVQSLNIKLEKRKGFDRLMGALAGRQRRLSESNEKFAQLKEIQEKYERVNKSRVVMGIILGAAGGALGGAASNYLQSHIEEARAFWFGNNEAVLKAGDVPMNAPTKAQLAELHQKGLAKAVAHAAEAKATAAAPENLEARIEKLSIVKKGDGFSQVVGRQLKALWGADPQEAAKHGLTPEDIKHGSAKYGEAVKKILTANGILSEDGKTELRIEGIGKHVFVEKLPDGSYNIHGDIENAYRVPQNTMEHVGKAPEYPKGSGWNLKPESTPSDAVKTANRALWSQFVDPSEVSRYQHLIDQNPTVHDVYNSLADASADKDMVKISRLYMHGPKSVVRPEDMNMRLNDWLKKILAAEHTQAAHHPVELSYSKSGIILRGPVNFEYGPSGEIIGIDPHDVILRGVSGDEYFNRAAMAAAGGGRDLRLSGLMLNKNILIYDQIKDNPARSNEADWLIKYIKKSLAMLEKETPGIIDKSKLPNFLKNKL